MAMLSKEDAKNHREACALVALDRDLTEDERDIVLRYWQESSNVTNKLDGAFFTPEALAYDLQFHVHGDRIIDLCAGIGTLAFCNRELYARRLGTVKTSRRARSCVWRRTRPMSRLAGSSFPKPPGYVPMSWTCPAWVWAPLTPR